MNPVILALQFVSVAFFVVMGVLSTVTNFMYAWNPKIKPRGEVYLWANALFGVALLGVAVLLSALYGWVG